MILRWPGGMSEMEKGALHPIKAPAALIPIALSLAALASVYFLK